MTKLYLNGWQDGELNLHLMLIELGVRDLAEMKVRKEFKPNALSMLVDRIGIHYKLIDLNETYFGLLIWKHEIIGQVVERLESITDPVLLSYLNGKLFGYTTSEILISDH
ncbi:MAG: hypothetical protein IPO78_17550 [Saprospiraceae bacterium]|nr:hypothetical protein [Saprospiraceae bacterium]